MWKQSKSSVPSISIDVIDLLDPYIIGVRENYRRAEKFLEVAIGDKGLMMTKALNNHIKMC